MSYDTPPFDENSKNDDFTEYFEIKDPIYIKNLQISLKKLRRYRWLYRQSKEHYKRMNDRVIYYPTFIFGILISILSLFAGASVNNNNIKVTAGLNYTIAILGLFINGLHRLQTKEEYEAKRIKFGEAGHTCDLLIVKISNEIKFPNDVPEKFVLDVENEIMKMKDRLYYEPPSYLVLEYVKAEAENPSEISSEDLKLMSTPNNKTNSKQFKHKLKKDCYDYDIIDDIKAQKEYEIQQRSFLDNPLTSIHTVVSPKTTLSPVSQSDNRSRTFAFKKSNKSPLPQKKHNIPNFSKLHTYGTSDSDVVVDIEPPLPDVPFDTISIQSKKIINDDNASMTSIESFKED